MKCLFVYIRVFALLITYFIVGTLVLKVGMHAEGREIVPQVVFWTAIPGLIKVPLNEERVN